jgi:opacity protein-like surface antigen
MGEYRESRAWRGGDPRLAQALNGTETAHSPWSIGILGGMEGRNGWGISIGLGYNAAHYDFHHVDRILSRNDSLVPYVITFNSQVIASYMDTVTTFSEERHPVAAMNRYSLIRVPIEVSWHRPWRRWQYGLRAGLSAEFNTMISGITLVSDGNESGTRSVDVASDLERRTNALLTGSVAADLGYALTDRWALWASPTVAIGLLPLSHASDAPYAMPDRLGMRLRLSYSFREHR